MIFKGIHPPSVFFCGGNKVVVMHRCRGTIRASTIPVTCCEHANDLICVSEAVSDDLNKYRTTHTKKLVLISLFNSENDWIDCIHAVRDDVLWLLVCRLLAVQKNKKHFMLKFGSEGKLTLCTALLNTHCFCHQISRFKPCCPQCKCTPVECLMFRPALSWILTTII